MHNAIPCLLDSNSIVKNYSTESGSDKIQYLFDESPSAQINIVNFHIPEVVSVFHKLHAKKMLTDNERDIIIDTFLKDIRDNLIMPYLCKDSHFEEIYKNLYTSYSTPVPKKRLKYFEFLGRWAVEGKEIADTLDIAMLTMMQEIKGIVGESYLFTSDGHVKAIAKKMNLVVLDPEKMSFKDMPFSLDKRCLERRKDIRAHALCYDLASSNLIASRHALDISPSGARINLGKKLAERDSILVKLVKAGDKSTSFEIKCDVVWSTKKELGVRFIEPDNVPLASLQ